MTIWTRKPWLRGVLGALALMLLAAACASTTDVAEPIVVADEATPTVVAPPTAAPTAASVRTPVPTAAGAPPAALLPAVETVAPELADLGALIAVHSEPARQTFDAAGGSLTLADGATIQVPTDSFTTPVEVTVVIADLLFGKYLDNAPQGRIYRLSTVEDVELLRPLVLEIPKSGESVTVSLMVDGVWTEQTIPALETTRIEVTHFSIQNLGVVDRPLCAESENRTLDGCKQINAMWGDYFHTDETGPFAESEAEVTVEAAAARAEICKGFCPTRTAPASTGQSQTTGSTSTTPAEGASSSPVSPNTPSSPPTTGSTTSCRTGYTSNNGKCVTSQNCEYPKVDLDRNGKSCVTEAICLSVGVGWSSQNGKCTGPPPCEGEALGYYTRDNTGTCRTPIYKCAHPQLDYPHIPGCTTRGDCAPSSAGYSIEGSKCVFNELQCDSGYVYNGSECVTLNYGCSHPKVDYSGVGQPASCISRDQCVNIGSGWGHSQGRCTGPELNCESGYSASSGSCVTPNLRCSHPSVEYYGVGQQECLSPSACTAIGSGYFASRGKCERS